jgi:capsular polysaccharide transport system ATP-binding protein
MIVVDNVHKRYQTDHGPGQWVLQGVNLTIPPRVSVGLVGSNGAGKSTLLRIIGGIDQPNKGRVQRHCRVSWPMGFGGGLQGSLTGRQNAKFVCRVHGREADMAQRIAQVESFAEIGPAFDEPVKTYSSGMKSRLQFGLSLAFDFDVYISDEVTSTGDAAFQKKAQAAFKALADHASLIMVSHSPGTLKQFCQAGVWLHHGQAHWFDDINEALRAYAQADPVKKALS